jgi:hypothetical protein
MADQFLDVNAAIPERTALLVRLGDFRLEGDDAFKSRLEVRHRSFLSSSSRGVRGSSSLLAYVSVWTSEPDGAGRVVQAAKDPLPDAVEPGIHCARTHWNRGSSRSTRSGAPGA